MAKRKGKRQWQAAVKGFGASDQVRKNMMVRVDKFLHKKEWENALKLLLELDKKYTDDPEIWARLCHVYSSLSLSSRFLAAAKKYHQITQDKCEGIRILAKAYMFSDKLMSAAFYCKQFLSQCSDHRATDEIESLLSSLQDVLAEDRQMNNLLTEDEALMMQFEEGLHQMELGNYAQARSVFSKIFEADPTLIPVYNNIAGTWELEGNLDQAIAMTQQVLSIDPENYFAHANLCRFLLFSGDREAAVAQLAKMRCDNPQEEQFYRKKAETLIFLQDFDAITQLEQEWEQQGNLDKSHPALLHFFAVAQMHQGHKAKAKSLWQQALDIDGGFSLAQQNLDDLDTPPSMRHAPFAFDIDHWISKEIIEDLIKTQEIETQDNDDPEDSELLVAANNFFQKYPSLEKQLPLMWQLGDGITRKFLLSFAKDMPHPSLLKAVADFGLSKVGPDSLRMEALQIAQKNGVIPQDKLTIWAQGEWKEVELIMTSIVFDSPFEHSPKAQALLKKGVDQLKKKNGADAEKYLQQAIDIEAPEKAQDLWFNLAAAYELQNEGEKADELLRKLLDEFPNYAFPYIRRAMKLIDADNIEEAKTLLIKVQKLPEIHISEYAMLCQAQIDLAILDKDRESCEQWLEQWQGVDPEDPNLKSYQRALDTLTVHDKLDAIRQGTLE